MKYKHTTYIEAEVFDPKSGSLPKGVMVDGRNNPRDMSAGAFMVKTNEGAQYIKPGDYIATMPDGGTKVFSKEAFESFWKSV